ncbi:MAG: substrate binding domain-containing protein, partial [Pseudomonadota bacterium]
AHPTGTLTIAGATYSTRHILTPHLPAFAAAYPHIKVNLSLQNYTVDLVAESVDLAFRIGEPKGNTLIAKKCGDVCLAMTAAPSFLKKYGRPVSIDDLPDFPCLLDTTPKGANHWPISMHRKINYVFEANDGEIIRQMTLAGVGISMVPSFFVDDDVRDGKLVRLFEEELDVRMGVHFVLPQRKQITSNARTFVEFVGPRINAEQSLL